jgi:hypothetical protein
MMNLFTIVTVRTVRVQLVFVVCRRDRSFDITLDDLF